VLFVKGDSQAVHHPKNVAIVGTREPTQYGETVAQRSGKTAVKAGFVVVSGLAHGCDTFAHEGCEVSPYYDSMIAKLMTHGRDRAESIARMRRCLDVMIVEGIKTNIPLHRKILDDPDFVAGRFDTGYMERFLPQKKATAAS